MRTKAKATLWGSFCLCLCRSGCVHAYMHKHAEVRVCVLTCTGMLR